MAEDIEFDNEWFYFKDGKGEQSKNEPNEAIYFRLPTGPLHPVVVFYPASEVSTMLAQIVITTLYQVKEDWLSFLKIHTKPGKQSAIIFCHAQSQAMQLGFKNDFDFERLPVWYGSYWDKPTDAEQSQEKKKLIVKLILTDEYEAFKPDKVVENVIYGINTCLIHDLGGVSAPDRLAREFCKACRSKFKKIFSR